MNYIYRFDDIQTIIRRKISASKWTPGRYPHKGYHQLSNKLKPNQQIFSLSFWKSENHMKENEKNHNTERNGEIKNLKLYIRVNENSNFFKKYTRINDDGFTDEILGSTAWLYYQIQETGQNEEIHSHSTDTLPLEEVEIFDIDGTWKKFNEAQIIQTTSLPHIEKALKKQFQPLELDSLGNKKFWFLLEDGQLLIYSPEYIEQLTWEGNNECKIHILKKIWLLLSIPSKQKISVFWVYRRCEDKEAFNQAADLKYLNPDISLEMMEVCKNSYIEKFFSNDFKINNELKLNELRLNEKKQEFPILKHLDEHYSFYLLLKEYRKTIKQYLSDV